MALLLERTAPPSPTEIDPREAIAAIVAREGVPAPTFVLANARRGAVSVKLTNRDAVDEWAAMLRVPVARATDSYGVHWSERAMHALLPGLFIDFFCDVPPVVWQPRTLAVTA